MDDAVQSGTRGNHYLADCLQWHLTTHSWTTWKEDKLVDWMNPIISDSVTYWLKHFVDIKYPSDQDIITPDSHNI